MYPSVRDSIFSCDFYYKHVACILINNGLSLDKHGPTIHKISLLTHLLLNWLLDAVTWWAPGGLMNLLLIMELQTKMFTFCFYGIELTYIKFCFRKWLWNCYSGLNFCCKQILKLKCWDKRIWQVGLEHTHGYIKKIKNLTQTCPETNHGTMSYCRWWEVIFSFKS